MYSKSSILAALTLASSALGEFCSTTCTTAEVPTGTPVAGDYDGYLRPQVHFSPPKGFMNDPNGLHRGDDGIWHMYYQYNPTDTVAGNQHWGHATSEDLYTWTNQPIALYPVNASSYIFTGSAVVDENNTSGFFPNQTNGVVAIYTIATYEPIELQTQGIAYSRDGGYSFTPYDGNPVLDEGSSQFRDPKVIWYEDHWVMVISFSQESVMTIYTSKDLKNWTFASNFTRHGLLGLQYECPNLVRIPVDGQPGQYEWMMFVSINPGAPLGGSGSWYTLGDFDGYTFTPHTAEIHIPDWGKDAYAGQFFESTPGEAILINWASNWQYTNAVPTGPKEEFRSAMGAARRISIKEDPRLGPIAASEPYDMSPILGEELASDTFGNGSVIVDFADVYSNAVMVEMNVTDLDVVAGSVNYTFLSPISGEYLTGGVLFNGNNDIWQDRSHIKGFEHPLFTGKLSTAQIIDDSFTMQVVFDRSIIETYIQGGLQASTSTFFPDEPLTILSVKAGGYGSGNVSTSVRVHALESTWRPQENSEGVVRGASAGNSTSGYEARRLSGGRFSK
ncbi:hypothetical protein D0867_15004 [Hortaea werneckii]|uniref:Glycosyl hydrolase family 32 N-terminal domain-containing protein n=1 Tax=Hortaea werneckii TaxID=91943 RepID=A0A3M6XKV2_HORWE|nr:hypothetical protein D0867_15004 [Hortaea werneckii]RMY13163.1 hypothetical protein D0866_14111 [Hortaea werneckii]